MAHYTYRCIPSHMGTAPSTKNIHGGATSWLYEQIAAQMRDGFEFHGSHEVRTFQPAGCLGALFGESNRWFVTTVLVFRRLDG